MGASLLHPARRPSQAAAPGWETIAAASEPETAWWRYGPPPGPLDQVVNTALTKGLRLLLHALLRAYLRVFHRFRPGPARRRAGRLGGHLIVANHGSHLDGLALMSMFPLRRVNAVRCLCAKDYFFGHPLKAAIAFLFGNSIPMDRDRYDAKAMALCLREIRAGGNVILFPEGRRSPDGRMGPFLPGVGLLAIRHGLPVLPAFIRGAYDCCRKGVKIPRPGPVAVTLGRPVRYGGDARGRSAWQRAADDLRRRVSQLSRQKGCITVSGKVQGRQGVLVAQLFNLCRKRQHSLKSCATSFPETVMHPAKGDRQ